MPQAALGLLQQIQGEYWMESLMGFNAASGIRTVATSIQKIDCFYNVVSMPQAALGLLQLHGLRSRVL